MEELAEIVVDIETYDDQIEPMHRLYTAVKHMIERKSQNFWTAKQINTANMTKIERASPRL